VEVHILPLEVGELSPPHPRVQGDDNEGMKVVWQRDEQSALLRVRQHTNPLVVLLQKLHSADRIAPRSPLRASSLEGTADAQRPAC